jgi:thioredoxin 2
VAQTYVACEKCQQINRVDLSSKKEAICGACKSTLQLHGAVVDGSDLSLQKLIDKSPLPVVIDVWADWCGPCRSFAPTFKEVSEDFAGKVVFVKLNSDKNQQMSSRLLIRSIPTIIIFKNGHEAARQSGALPKDQFSHWLRQNTV